MTDQLPEIKQTIADADETRFYGGGISNEDALELRDQLKWAVSEFERLQRFEAMWEDACRHRDTAEARARHYQDLLRAIEVLVRPEEEPL